MNYFRAAKFELFFTMGGVPVYHTCIEIVRNLCFEFDANISPKKKKKFFFHSYFLFWSITLIICTYSHSHTDVDDCSSTSYNEWGETEKKVYLFNFSIGLPFRKFAIWWEKFQSDAHTRNRSTRLFLQKKKQLDCSLPSTRCNLPIWPDFSSSLFWTFFCSRCFLWQTEKSKTS